MVEPDAALDQNVAVLAIIQHLQAIADGALDPPKLCVSVPPGSLKSTLCSVLFPGWVWTRRPSAKFIFSSSKNDLAIRDSTRTRRLCESGWYQTRWPRLKFRDDQNQKHYFETEQGGHRVVVNIGHGTGYRADFVIVDDPNQVLESDNERADAAEWWFSTIPSRLDDPKTGSRIIIQQRTSMGDLTGETLRRKSPVVHLMLPMEFEPERRCVTPIFQDPRTEPGQLLMPHRVDKATVEQLKSDLGSWMYAAQYQQRPVALEGNIVKRAWLRYHYGLPGQVRRRALDDVGILEDLPALDRGILFTSTDCTFKDKIDNDFTVVTLWLAHCEKFYLIDMRRGQWSLTRVCRELMEISRQYRGISLHLIEKTANGPEIIQQLQPYVRGLVGVSPKGKKIARLMACTPLMEGGNVVIPHPQLFPWVTDELLSELLAFPHGERDDVVDSVSQALNEGNLRFGAAGGFAGERAEMLF